MTTPSIPSAIQERYDRQSPPESGHLPCANCGERAEDHERRTVGLTEYIFCEDGGMALDELLEDKDLQFNEVDDEPDYDRIRDRRDDR